MSDKPKLFLALNVAEYEYLRGLVVLGSAIHDIAGGPNPDEAARDFSKAAHGIATLVNEANKRLGKHASQRLIIRFFEDGETTFAGLLTWHTEVGKPDPAITPIRPLGPLVYERKPPPAP